MTRILLTLTLLLAAIGSTAQDNKKYQGLLWEISGNGLSKPSYLYGTMHVSEKLAFHLSDTFFIALKNVDLVALELDPGKWMEETLEMDNAFEQKEYVTSARSASGYYSSAFKPFFPEKNELMRLLRSKPRIINNMLYRSNEAYDEFEEDTYLDLFIYQTGKKLGKNVIGLEDFMVSRKLVDKAYQGEDDEDDENYKNQKERNRILIRQMEKVKSMREYQEDSYRNGDLDMLDSIYRLTNPGTVFLRYMLWERNVIMANQMDSIMKKQTLFTGVGAAHLPGEKGVIELLRSKGYKVRPIVYTNINGDKRRTEIEKMKFPVTFKTRFPEDSAFSCEVPGELFRTLDRPGKIEYLYNDMSNGSYYHIQRLAYLGKLDGKDQQHTLKRLDSLLYENIPGKIQSKKEIKASNGYSGWDIVNKTRRGDLQRYQILVGPLEIFVFKMSGPNEYISGKEGDQFFNSIKWKSVDLSARSVYSPKAGGFTIMMPAVRVINRAYALRSGILRHAISASDENGDLYFMFHSQVNDFRYIEEDTFELNYLSEVFAEELKAKITRRSLVGPTELHFSIRKEERNIRLRILIQGENYYMAGTTCTDSLKAEAYLNSLNTKAYTYSLPFEKHIDSTLYFTVKTVKNPSPYTSLTEQNRNNTKKSKKDETVFRPVTITRTYGNFETGEKLQVEFRKFSMYYQMEHPDTFWRYQEVDLAGESNMIIRKNKPGFLRNDTIRDYLLVDTNSTRGILVRKIQKCGVLYTLRAQIDTTQGQTPFVKSFFESFQPLDTCLGVDLYSDKIQPFFFDRIYSKDTLIRKQAFEAMEYVIGNLLDNQAPQTIKFIEHPEFKDLPYSDKQRFLIGLGRLKHDAVLPFYEKLYRSYADSSGLQLAILRGVARQRTEKSMKLFLKLLQTDLPVSSKTDEIERIFNTYHDTLELGARLFPELLRYTKFPEYKTPVYHLMSELVMKGHLKPAQYKKFKSDILSDANYDLKIYLTSEGNEYRYYSRKFRSKGELGPENTLDEEQLKIFGYAVLLSPFHKEADVKKYLDKIQRTPKHDLKIVLSAYYAKRNVPVMDSVWTFYAKKPDTRALLFASAEYFDVKKVFPATYSSQEMISIGVLYSGQKDAEKDTIVLLQRIENNNLSGGGYVYLFKYRAKDKRVWRLAFVGYQPKDEGQSTVITTINRKGTSFEGQEMLDKEISNFRKEIRTEGRKRAKSSGYGGFESMFGGFDF
ncbi:MAG TPA: TraB/GumN family protein [Flavobacteriales bacterium]|nr:TraB/GumN family protein [Flavobacteriales bacterium]HRE96570.1 TraB/GumN family protein [Flavobacteriales bacterium]HRJ38849.1 TraB/GumN family protein [Flavobacteriales bacterium]